MSVSQPAAISQEEFQRLQTQLLDLRTANYTLMEESNRYKNDLKNSLLKLENLEKDNQKLQKIQEKSRKAKDVEMLFAENDLLQQRLVLQEEQFRIQNQTLMNELTLLVTSNDKLESAVKNQQSSNAERPEMVTADSQCDLSTAYFDKCIEEEKCLVQQFKNESLSKDTLIDELNLNLQQLKDELNKLQVEAQKVPILSDKLEYSCNQVKDAEAEKTQLKLHIEEMERSARDEMNKLQETHQQEITNMRLLYADEMKQCEIQVELVSAQKIEFEEAAGRYRQEAQDAVEDVRIAERRITSITADLRRQLRGERRRADKLQERLRDFVSGDSSFQMQSAKFADTSIEQDNCSVSSWSLMSGQNEANNAPVQSSSPYPTTNSPGSDRTRSRADNEQSAPDLMVENSRLVARLATMQQEKWRIEERVSHLEENSATMAQELINRGKLIQHYCMDTRKIVKSENVGSNNIMGGGEKMSVRRMVSLIRQIGSDSDTTEMDTQRRLQRMLEETLTKNMHLQEDVERLSQEIVRLSQIVGSANLN